MSEIQSFPTRRDVFGTAAVTAAAIMIPSTLYAAAENIRPFRIHVPDEALGDLRQRIAATKWPRRETVADALQGVQLATMRNLANYWQTEHPTYARITMNQQSKVHYTDQVHTTGGREGGAARSSDGNLDVRISPPGSRGAGMNPEQLFAAD
jgi:hypothetical protein